MMILRFRDSSEHQDLLKKIKRMKQTLDEVEDCLEEASETSYREREYEPRSRYDYDKRY